MFYLRAKEWFLLHSKRLRRQQKYLNVGFYYYNMHLDYKNLTQEELKRLRLLLKKYKNYDKIDLLIELFILF